MADRVQRVASVIKLLPEGEERYLDLHRAVWPAVESRLHAAGITNYSIFLRDGLLFSYFEYAGENLEADLAALDSDATMQQWLRVTGECQQPLPSARPGERWVPAVEVYRLGRRR